MTQRYGSQACVRSSSNVPYRRLPAHPPLPPPPPPPPRRCPRPPAEAARCGGTRRGGRNARDPCGRSAGADGVARWDAVVYGVLHAVQAAAAGRRPTARSASPHTFASCLPFPLLLPVLGAAKHLEVAACVLIAAAVGYRWWPSAVRQIAQSLTAHGTQSAVRPCAPVHARQRVPSVPSKREPVADIGRHCAQARSSCRGLRRCAL